MGKLPLPQPLIDTLDHLYQLEPTATSPEFAKNDLFIAIDFLKQYGANKSTFEAYRRELERLLQWAWLIAKKSLLEMRRQDVERYIAFCLNPPKQWIGIKQVRRYIDRNGKRYPNPNWRPFVVTVTKAETQMGKKPEKAKYILSQKAIREIFTVLNSFYNYLLLESKVEFNPVALIKQKSKYLRKQQYKTPVRKLSELQWAYCIEAAEKLAMQNPKKYERTLFMITALYLLYLRISELVANQRWEPQMGHFYQDSHGNWWFKTVGKGNKERDVSVSRDMLKALARYRQSRELSPALPLPGETTPLIHKLRGQGPLCSDREARQIIQVCFDQAMVQLKKDGFKEDALALSQATVHWLRHTGISDDINKHKRPVAHVRDDAGHSSSAITDRYNDIELQERHHSAQKKIAKPDAPA